MFPGARGGVTVVRRHNDTHTVQTGLWCTDRTEGHSSNTTHETVSRVRVCSGGFRRCTCACTHRTIITHVCIPYYIALILLRRTRYSSYMLTGQLRDTCLARKS